DVTYEDSAPFPPSATSIQGRAQFRNGHNQLVSFGGTSKADVNTDNQGPGDTALDNTTNDPRGDFAGRDAAEDKIVTNLPFLSGLGTSSSSSVLNVTQSTQTQETVNTPLLNGPLEFILAWQSVNYASGTAAPTNLDLAVTDPLGNTISKNQTTAGTG